MTVEGNHDWGCGALNGTSVCMCRPYCPEEVVLKPVKPQPKTTLSDSLSRQDELQRKIKAGNVDNEA